jgi:PAS domain S-box-containing protein
MSRDNDEGTNLIQRNDECSFNNYTNAATLSEAREELTEHQYSILFETMPQGMICHDSSGQIIRANLAAQQILGLTLNQLHSRTLPSCLALLSMRDEDGNLLSEELWPVQRILAGEVLRDAKAVDVIVRRLDGQDRQISVSGASTYDSHGQISGVVTILQDVTSRRAMERRTQRSLDVILAMAGAMTQEQQDRELLVADDLEVSGAPHITRPPAESIAGRRLLELPCQLLDCQSIAIAMLDPQTGVLQPTVIVSISPEHELHWRNSLQEARLNTLLGNASLVARLHAGEVLSLDISHPLFRDQPSCKLITPILKGRELIGILLLGYSSIKPGFTSQELAIIHAIAELASLLIERERTQRERDQALAALQAANDELEHTGRRNSDFLSIVSHEFRTALTGIQGFSELMRDEDLSVMEMKEFAVDIHTDARRLVRMITDMLNMERMEGGRMPLNLSRLDLNEIIMDVVGRMHSSTTRHVIFLQLASVLPVLLGDYDKLTQVVSKLLQNAIKYSPAGSEVIVSSNIEGNMVHVCVRDYGVGIPIANQERIFERSAHVELSSLRYIEGTGPKLPIVCEIIQMHGGQVWVESGVGKGSIFHFTVRFTNSHQ